MNHRHFIIEIDITHIDTCNAETLSHLDNPDGFYAFTYWLEAQIQQHLDTMESEGSTVHHVVDITEY